MSEEHEFCCGILRIAVENYDFPFEWPMFLDPETLDMKANRLSIILAKETLGGSISRIGVHHARIIYCPFCGTKLLKDDD
jgi:hypothetical protein